MLNVGLLKFVTVLRSSVLDGIASRVSFVLFYTKKGLTHAALASTQ